MSNRDRNKPAGDCKTSRLVRLHDKEISWSTIKKLLYDNASSPFQPKISNNFDLFLDKIWWFFFENSLILRTNFCIKP